MPNYYWYLFVTIIISSTFLYTIYKKKEKKQIISLYLTMVGLTYLFEFIVLVLFKSYRYYPNILKIHYFDNLFGAVFSDAFIVPMTSSVVAAYNLPILIFVLVLMIIELFFQELGIYEHYWWKTIYTGIGLIFAFTISKKLFFYFKYFLNKKIRFLALFSICIGLHASILFILAGIFHLFIFQVNWFDDPIRGNVAFSSIYIIFQSLLFGYILAYKLKRYLLVLSIILLSMIDFTLSILEILHFYNGWALIFFLLMRVCSAIILGIINKYLLFQEKQKISV